MSNRQKKGSLGGAERAKVSNQQKIGEEDGKSIATPDVSAHDGNVNIPAPDECHRRLVDHMKSRIGEGEAWNFCAKRYETDEEASEREKLKIPEPKFIAQYFRPEPDRDAELLEWLRRHDDGTNHIWYGDHTHLRRPSNDKAAKNEVKSKLNSLADIDPPKGLTGEALDAWREKTLDTLRNNLPPGLPPLTELFDSGRGFWLKWYFETPFDINGDADRTMQYERHARGVVAALKVVGLPVDSCYDTCRLVRAPYTINPKTGRRAAVVEYFPERLYKLDDFPVADAPTIERGDDANDYAGPQKSFRELASRVRCLNAAGHFVRYPGDNDEQKLGWLGLGFIADKRFGQTEEGYALFSIAHNSDEANRDGRGKWDSGHFVDKGSPNPIGVGTLIRFSDAAGWDRAAFEQEVYEEFKKAVEDAPKEKAVDMLTALLCEQPLDPSKEGELAKIAGDRFGGRREAKAALKQAREKQQRKAVKEAEDFKFNKNGIDPTLMHNSRLALKRLGVKLRRDIFSGDIEVTGLAEFGPRLDDHAAIRARSLVEKTFGFLPGKDVFYDVLADEANQNRFHPVRDYLDSLVWDGVPRIDTWLIDYGGAEDTTLNRAFGRLFLLAAVRRVREPGTKFDQLLVLENPNQGTDKSSGLCALAVKDEWFLDGLDLSAEPKTIIEQTRGKWIVEHAELSGIARRDTAHVKTMLSRRSDTSRLAYGRISEHVPRQFLPVGTTNDAAYLHDDQNRRFWPVANVVMDAEKIKASRDQLWAEAAAREATGESIVLPRELWKTAAVEQSARRILNPFAEALQARIGDEDGWLMASDVWELLGIPISQQSASARGVGSAMKELGFKLARVRGGENRGARFYYRGTSDTDLAVGGPRESHSDTELHEVHLKRRDSPLKG
ncbi:MAG TPA: virulence-associated E family protein [Methylocystis sp.]|jgi:hypothetical protein